jgi:crotonobetainyl-CoA:carnitine CoA-transferase CaiB-like acyl-CoA transferase
VSEAGAATSRELPLAGVRVLSLGHTLPGLFCLAMLRDLGAEIVRIERIPRASGEAGPYSGLGGLFPMRSARAGTSECRLDLRNPSGRDAYLRLAARADAVLEGFRPGVAARLGVDYAVLSRARPALVYAAISGYGQEGPLAERAGHDLNYLAETGALALANPPGLPGTTFADGMAGLAGALNVVAALMHARATGVGRFLDLAIVDSPLFLLASELEYYWKTGVSRSAGDTHLAGRYPWYALHATRDGGHVAVGAVEPHFYAALCEKLGLPELAEQQYAEGAQREAAARRVAEAFAARTRDEVDAMFGETDACASRARTIAEVAASEFAERAERRADGEGARAERLVRTPVRFGDAALARERGTQAVLADVGFASDEIARLRSAGAVGAD